MDLLTLLRAVLRRWYVALPMILAAGGAAFYLQSTVPPQYTAEGSVLLENPEFDPSSLPIAMIDLPSLVGRTQNATSAAAGDGVEVLVQARDRMLAEVVASAPDPAQAETTARGAVDLLAAEVQAIQEAANVPEEDQVRVSTTEPVAIQELGDGRFEAATTAPIRDPAAEVPNPYDAGGTTAQLLEVAVTSDAGRARVAELTGPGVSFTLGTSTRDGAIIGITTLGSDPQSVLDAFEPVRLALQEELQARQDRAEVPRSRHISVEVLAAPASVSDVSPPVDRSAAAVFGLGGVLAVVIAVVLDSLLARRRISRTGRDDGTDTEGWWQSIDSDTTAEPSPEEEGPRSRPTRAKSR